MAIPFYHPLDDEIRTARAQGAAAADPVPVPAPQPRASARQRQNPRQPGGPTPRRQARLDRQSAISGYEIATNENGPQFPINRSGGYFMFMIKDGSWRSKWQKIARATRSGKLGHCSTIPKPRKNREYAKARGTNPLWYPIFVHTHDTSDREHRERILTKIIDLTGIPAGDIKYTTSQQTDNNRQRRR